MIVNYVITLIFYLCGAVQTKVDVRQTAANKAFVASIGDGEYEVVHPFQIRDRNERIGIDTRNYFLRAAEHYQQVNIVIRSSVVGRLKLVLERNNYIFLNGTSFRKLDSMGEGSLPTRVENCYYQGIIHGEPNSFVALSSCNGLRGVVSFSNGSQYGIWPLDGGDRGRRHPHILYKTQWTKDARCGAVTQSPIHQTAALTVEHIHRHRRRDVSKQTKYIEVAAIADYEMMKMHGLVEEEAVTYILESINIADLMLSRDLNIRLSVVYAELWLDVQRIDLYEDIERTIAGVTDYAAGHIYNIPKDAVLLYTGGSFANSEMSTAAFRSICTARASAVIKAVDEFSAQWSGQLVAQSVGHLLGLEHDTVSCQCPGPQTCVMAQQPGSPGAPLAWQFSKCSVARMHSVWQSGRVQCLLNRPFQASTLRECGNGIVDSGEECDCGSRDECDDVCCDALTCTLRPHAQCAGHHACCHRCELKKPGSICRPSKSTCDVAEMCDGKSGDCPADGHFIDGTTCGEDGRCWRGNCSDPHSQCKTIWGSDAKVAETDCFEQNSRGHEYANCGQDSTGDGVRSCQQEDIRCGSLHCAGGSATPLLTSLRAFTTHFKHKDRLLQCKSVADSPAGQVHDGSACGDARVCVAGSCVEISSVSAIVKCPTNNLALQCSGHGDCTTTALCVCFAGWGGNACDTRTNGSIYRHRTQGGDRKMVTIPSLAVGKSLETATLLGILLLVGVFLLLVLVCLLFCYRRRTVIEVPCAQDEKADESMEDVGNRAIKFGSMPSWREEKLKRKSNKHIYGALNRITEADERDSVSLRSRESGSQGVGSQLLFEGRPLPSSRSDVACNDRAHEHVYSDSPIGVTYTNRSPMRESPLLRHNHHQQQQQHRHHDGYGTDVETYGMRSFHDWPPDGPPSSARGGLPLRLHINNYGQIQQQLRQLRHDEEHSPSQSHHSSFLHHNADHMGNSAIDEATPFPMPVIPTLSSAGVALTELRDEHSATEVDFDNHDVGSNSNTESTRGWEVDEIHKSSTGDVSSSKGDFRNSPSLFSDPFKLEMTSSIHT